MAARAWVVRLSGPEVAKLMRPRRFECTPAGSSVIRWFFQRPVTAGSAAKPNCAMKPEMTRKNAAPSKKPVWTSVKKRAAPFGAHS